MLSQSFHAYNKPSLYGYLYLWISILFDIIPATSTYIFSNTFFRMDWPDDEKSSSDSAISRLRLSTLLKLRREANIWPAYSRSKVIVKPKMIVQLGVHFVYIYVDSFLANDCEVPHHQALLHHYRAWEDDDAGVAGVSDRRMTNFTEKIISRTSFIHEGSKGFTIVYVVTW